ncbi:hypothetical protein EV702DRAFT_1044482 [Suillus placidus]|uniref:Uncharacterized protein n=1 Tax=Suillus placidus TaxID=48579 RepID=A0A9P7D394_9AGAM|nr:hypothetical protein EV702DRAFT_1044482 [Suillus placidus]
MTACRSSCSASVLDARFPPKIWTALLVHHACYSFPSFAITYYSDLSPYNTREWTCIISRMIRASGPWAHGRNILDYDGWAGSQIIPDGGRVDEWADVNEYSVDGWAEVVGYYADGCIKVDVYQIDGWAESVLYNISLDGWAEGVVLEIELDGWAEGVVQEIELDGWSDTISTL